MTSVPPPFGAVPGQPAADAAADIVAVCETVAARPDKVQWVERETTRRFEGTADAAMAATARASRAIARAVDADARGGDRPAYHNRQHLCEVMLVACFLGHLHGLRPDEAQRLLLAALLHDLGHDGGRESDFGAERRSLAVAAPFLRSAGVDAGESRRLAALVLATAPRLGTRTALAAARAHAASPPVGTPAVPALAAELDLLVRDASLARLAVLLCEADVLPSAGLTPAHGLALQRRLAEEWRRPLDRDDKRRFLDTVLADGVVGPYFRPNVVACRAGLEAFDDEPFRC